MKVEIKGKAKPVELKYGAWLRVDSCPCGKVCPERSEGCHGRCKRYKKWRFLHEMALDEQRRLLKGRKEAMEEHQDALEKSRRRNYRRKL